VIRFGDIKDLLKPFARPSFLNRRARGADLRKSFGSIAVSLLKLIGGWREPARPAPDFSDCWHFSVEKGAVPSY